MVISAEVLTLLHSSLARVLSGKKRERSKYYELFAEAHLLFQPATRLVAELYEAAWRLHEAGMCRALLLLYLLLSRLFHAPLHVEKPWRIPLLLASRPRARRTPSWIALDFAYFLAQPVIYFLWRLYREHSSCVFWLVRAISSVTDRAPRLYLLSHSRAIKRRSADLAVLGETVRVLELSGVLLIHREVAVRVSPLFAPMLRLGVARPRLFAALLDFPSAVRSLDTFLTCAPTDALLMGVLVGFCERLLEVLEKERS